MDPGTEAQCVQRLGQKQARILVWPEFEHGKRARSRQDQTIPGLHSGLRGSPEPTQTVLTAGPSRPCGAVLALEVGHRISRFDVSQV